LAGRRDRRGWLAGGQQSSGTVPARCRDEGSESPRAEAWVSSSICNPRHAIAFERKTINQPHGIRMKRIDFQLLLDL
jgi:hypothetical protein